MKRDDIKFKKEKNQFHLVFNIFRIFKTLSKKKIWADFHFAMLCLQIFRQEPELMDFF
jgi:hypothetical protein